MASPALCACSSCCGRAAAAPDGGMRRAQGERVFTSLTMANAGATEVRTRLRLRSTTPGANNRLDIAAIVSFDAGAGVATPMFGAGARA